MACDACARLVVQNAAINPISTKEQEEKSFKPGNKDREGEDWWNKPLDNPFHLVINKPFGSNGQPAVHRESHRDGPNRQSRETCSRLGPEDRKRSVWTGWMGRRFRTPLYAMKRRAHMRQGKKERSGGYLLSHG